MLDIYLRDVKIIDFIGYYIICIAGIWILYFVYL